MYPHHFFKVLDSIRKQDETSRRRFRKELGVNFSLVAPAGAGKTQAIAERVVCWMQAVHEGRHKGAYRDLVVVTYTRKAAVQLRDRVENCLVSGTHGHLLSHLDEVFFGTIHSFCRLLLSFWGHYLGLGSDLKEISVEDLDVLEVFLEEGSGMEKIDGDLMKSVRRFVALDDILKNVGKLSERSDSVAPPNLELPVLNLDDVLAVPEKGNGKGNIIANKKAVSEFLESYRRGDDHVPLPECQGKAKAMQVAWERSFRPFREWLDGACLSLALSLAREFLNFRKHRGLLTYSDLVTFTLKLLEHPIAGKKLRDQGYCLILDEAQDTDPDQFNIFLQITSSKESVSKDRMCIPRPGAFSMVGDPQQAIFSSRADLPTYLNLHERFRNEDIGETLVFSITYRLSEENVNFVNEAFPKIFTNQSSTPSNIDFVPLRTAEDACRGICKCIAF